MEDKNSVYISLLTMFITLLMSIGYLYLFQKNKKIKLGNPLLILAVLIGALLTTYLNINLGLGVVIGSAAVGVMGSFIPKNWPKKNEGNQFQTAIYCGSFIGMCQPLTENHYVFIGFASILSGIMFCISLQNLNGFGGKLGTLAFVGVALAVFLTFIFTGVWN
ncbi:hypothetical protein [Mesonia aquimarina]|uniref:hypothetical protein n=1 Tax=Mesonia aquimarina TaxID=1504967 RepID=UPI000EF5EDCC|nr:hypothetical protein [Mesonia aquimarina]